MGVQARDEHVLCWLWLELKHHVAAIARDVLVETGHDHDAMGRTKLLIPKSPQVVTPGVVRSWKTSVVIDRLAGRPTLVAHGPDDGLTVFEHEHRRPPARKNSAVPGAQILALEALELGQRLLNFGGRNPFIVGGLFGRLVLQ